MAGNKMGEQTRAKILLAAQQAFLEHGFENARMEDIAKRAGVTKVMLYYHFSTKQNLYAEIVQSVVAEIRQAFQASQAGLDLSDPAAFRAHLKNMFAFYQERRAILRLVISEQVKNPAGDSLAVFSDVFQLILDLPGVDPLADRQAFLTRTFFFNALPMLMYACLSEPFCAAFAIDPDASLETFTAEFMRPFINQAPPAIG